MKNIKNVVIVGLGAIGMIFASRIQKCEGHNLFALVDTERKVRYEKNGVVFNNQRYDFDYVLPTNEGNIKADLIIIATKSYGLNEAITMIEKYVGEDTVIISQLNGITSEEAIANAYGYNKVLYSMMLGHISTRINKGITHDGHIIIYFGDKDSNPDSENVLRVKALFDKVGITYKIPTDIKYAMWQKLVANVGYNQVTALTRADYSVLKKGGKTTEIAIKLINEAIKVAKAVGINNTEKILPDCLAIIEQMPANAKSSMLQDVEANRQLEVDLFAGTICKLGRKYGVATPYNDVVFELLTAINERIG